MRLLEFGLLGCVIVTQARAQYPYDPGYPGTVYVYAPPPAETRVVVLPERPRPISYFIAFKNSTVRVADAYWVSGNTLYYVTRDHQQMTAPLSAVDRALSQRLNQEQNVSFVLPAENQKLALRRLLERQFKLILETKATARGLIVRMADVLFATNQAVLTATAREKLAKLAGILVAYPCLSPRLEGFTDNVGTTRYNMELSTKRADAVRQYLISQGVPAAGISAKGFGEASPIATNDTPSGRQQNRRVEMVIPANVIGVTEAD
jgi:outer membrane protein OmpA-like peptidoglycan-associated protein